VASGGDNKQRPEHCLKERFLLFISLFLMTKIKCGDNRALGAYPRQNSLALALRELGRLERTLFTLQWLQSPELRQRVQLGLNKGEAKNALARAVFFNRLGELRESKL
jgi:TnpA family transposase